MLLAAGLGSRYGGVKPVAPVGPDGEPLVVMGVRQAVEAGFHEIVVVVGPATEAAVSEALVAVTGVRIALARQEVPVGRVRPLGTVDALLAAVDRLGSLPPRGLVVANGDDLYGVDALRMARTWVASADETNRTVGAAVMFEVARTLSPIGGVSRAVPVVADGLMTALEEQRDVHLEGGTVVTGTGTRLDPHTPVSMNLWCLRPPAIQGLREDAANVLGAHMNDPAAELGLPSGVDGLLRRGFGFEVLVTDSVWHGVTWPEDVARVRAALTVERDARRA